MAHHQQLMLGGGRVGRRAPLRARLAALAALLGAAIGGDCAAQSDVAASDPSRPSLADQVRDSAAAMPLTTLFEEAVTALEAGQAERAITIWRRLADRGDAHAMENLSRLAARGVGAPANLVAANGWRRRAAALGLPEAQRRLADDLLAGRAVPTGPDAASEARAWYRRAAASGDRAAQFSLGVAFEHGVGGPTDLVEAQVWMRRAAMAGDPRAAAALQRAKTSDETFGPARIETASVPRRSAEAQGETPVGDPLRRAEAERFLRAGDAAAAGQIFHRLGEEGDREALTALGRLRWEGLGAPMDRLAALLLWRRAASQGSAEAARLLAEHSPAPPAPSVGARPAAAQ